MDLVGAANWALFESLINLDAKDTFFKDTVIWRRYLGGIDEFMEDHLESTYTDITLETLIKYNDFKVWPLNQTSESGELDRQNAVLLFTIEYLNSLGYINANGNFVYVAATDRFIIDNQIYKATGDTKISQAKDKPLLYQINLSKEEIATALANN